MSEHTSDVYFVEIMKTRFGHSVQVRSRPARLPGPGIYSVVEARGLMTGDGIDTSWADALVMDVDRPPVASYQRMGRAAGASSCPPLHRTDGSTGYSRDDRDMRGFLR